MAARHWICTDESAKEMLSRVSAERPLMLLPPLHRVSLRLGNVVEIAGPSPSAKTQILIQAAIYCILPKEWRGMHYGGLEHLVLFLDLDCRFDILRLSQSLKHRLMEASEEPDIGYDEELFAACMRRFLYIRCYNSFEFLATLKTLHYQLLKARETHGVSAHFLMIDSIGAFYWVDRASTSLPVESNSRKRLSLQNVSETIVEEIRKLLLMHPMLVLATKATILADTFSTSEAKRASMNWPSSDPSDLTTVTGGPQKVLYHEYMPSVWRSFITHRILVRAADDDLANSKHRSQSIFLSEWLMPPLSLSDKFIVRDVSLLFHERHLWRHGIRFLLPGSGHLGRYRANMIVPIGSVFHNSSGTDKIRIQSCQII